MDFFVGLLLLGAGFLIGRRSYSQYPFGSWSHSWPDTSESED